MISNYNLFLDDCRQPDREPSFERIDGICRVIDFPLMKWEVVRNYNSFVEIITNRGLPERISFDHDLGEEHYSDGFFGKPPRYEEYKEKTGYDCLKWLVEYCRERKLNLPNCYVHSFNPIGRNNLFSLMEGYRKECLQSNQIRDFI